MGGITPRQALAAHDILDSEGEVSKAYLVMDLPYSFFVDKEGIIQDIYIGELSRGKMEERVQMTLK